MSTVATNAGVVSNNLFLHLMGMRPNHAPSAARMIHAGSCPPFPVDQAVQGVTWEAPFHHPGARLPGDSPERPNSQPWAVEE